jgi:hypothetical protein
MIHGHGKKEKYRTDKPEGDMKSKPVSVGKGELKQQSWQRYRRRPQTKTSPCLVPSTLT